MIDPDSKPIDRPKAPLLRDLINRRQLLKTSALGGALAALPATGLVAKTGMAGDDGPAFQPLAHGLDKDFHTSPDYQHQVVIRRGDPLLPGAPAYDPDDTEAESQRQQFGMANDFTAFMPLPKGSENSAQGLLVVNHEFAEIDTAWAIMKGLIGSSDPADLMQAGMGLSVVELRRRPDGDWQTVGNSPYARRITATSPIRFSGPAAGSDRLKTNSFPDGFSGKGTIGNCAGGVTPWGTVLTCEENIQFFYNGDVDDVPASEKPNYQRFGIDGEGFFGWGRTDDDYNLEASPHGGNHAGWVVELNPYDPQSTPIKRTALGRFKHEGAATHINKDGRLVVYMGDDQTHEYLYRFISRDPVTADSRGDLLDHGTLSVAVFDESGVSWKRLVQGEGPLTSDNGFNNQGDVVIEARRAADLFGATPMDRPEDVEVNPATDQVFVMLTNNAERTETNIANPRGPNLAGHILTLTPPDGDHGADRMAWDIFILAGVPDDAAPAGAKGVYHPAIAADGWFAAPDNCAFDKKGRLYIATDGAEKFGIADGVYVTATIGPDKALPKQLARTPQGSEMCGPSFTPDGKTLFVAVQHPGEQEDGGSWPDFDEDIPPRSSIVAISHKDGKLIGD